MHGKDEIIFSGEYKDFRFGVRFDVQGRTEAEVASVLGYISQKIEPHAFKFSGIDTKAIDAFASPAGKGISSVIAFLDANGPAGMKAALEKSLPKPELMPAAESYFFNRLLTKAGVEFKPKAETSLAPEEEKPDDFIGFMGKFGNWIAVKKLSLEKVQDYEVSGILAGINHTLVNKAFGFAGLQDGSAGALKGSRKSYNNLSASLKGLKDGGPADAMTVCRVFEGIGYRPYASPEMLTSAYPDIKPPKVKGRKPKG
ncbi:MAG TPA: DUF2666 family protein [Candidatus Bilamarchaeum sp.]|nr:DUF2666 family protein [Candidatus Bilamarchaeum sp.]